MSFDRKTLYELLPAIYRIRDAEQGEPLHALLQVIADQAAVLEESLAQLYDDHFVETAASWVLPYIGDLIGLTGLPSTDVPALSPRAEVAHTLGYRRRKGTAAILEQLARDITHWPARAVEFFELIAATQWMNHLRPANQAFISVRNADRLEDLGGAFERNTTFGQPDLTHNVDVRRIARGHGRYNIPDVGIFLWRLRLMSLTRSPAVADAPGDKRRFRFSPIGLDLPLFTKPRTETSLTHLAEPLDVVDRITRRRMRNALDDYYGAGKSLFLETVSGGGDPLPILSTQIEVCDLSAWAATLPAGGKISIDPVLGRIAFPSDLNDTLLATFHWGFSDNMGGGEYTRLRGAEAERLRVVTVATTIADALTTLGTDSGIVEIPNSGRYVETPALDGTGRVLELRAGDKHRPAIILTGDVAVTGGENDHVILDGLLLAGGGVHVTGKLGRLTLRHCTVVPGAHPSLKVSSTNTRVEIDRCILGGITTDASADVRISGSILDATYAGGPLRITNSTVLGAVKTSILRLASNCIFLGTVTAERRQEGCVRFSFLPPDSRVPRRYHCQPDGDASRIRPEFVSTHFGDPAYCQLHASCPPEIREGADDESSMGAFHDTFEPQKEARLRSRIEEYLRFGLEAGLFYAT
jgi:hypothetical protein